MEVISYFSYKGGAGRSSIACNVMPFLAEKLDPTPEQPIIVVDMDIDSAGLTFLMQKETEGAVKQIEYSTQEFIQTSLKGSFIGSGIGPDSNRTADKHPFFQKLNPVGTEFGLGEGERNDRKILLLEAKPGAEFESYNGGGKLLENPLKKLYKLCMSYGCKALIFDTPAGDQLTAKWSMGVSDTVVCCMRITFQFRRGTVNYLNRLGNENDGKRCIIVPNAVPQESIKVNGITFDSDYIRKSIIKDMSGDALKSDEPDLRMLEDGFLGIPEVKRFKFLEGILYKFNEHQDDEKKALESYKKLSDVILKAKQ